MAPRAARAGGRVALDITVHDADALRFVLNDESRRSNWSGTFFGQDTMTTVETIALTTLIAHVLQDASELDVAVPTQTGNSPLIA